MKRAQPGPALPCTFKSNGPAYRFNDIHPVFDLFHDIYIFRQLFAFSFFAY